MTDTGTPRIVYAVLSYDPTQGETHTTRRVEYSHIALGGMNAFVLAKNRSRANPTRRVELWAMPDTVVVTPRDYSAMPGVGALAPICTFTDGDTPGDPLFVIPLYNHQTDGLPGHHWSIWDGAGTFVRFTETSNPRAVPEQMLKMDSTRTPLYAFPGEPRRPRDVGMITGMRHRADFIVHKGVLVKSRYDPTSPGTIAAPDPDKPTLTAAVAKGLHTMTKTLPPADMARAIAPSAALFTDAAKFHEELGRATGALLASDIDDAAKGTMIQATAMLLAFLSIAPDAAVKRVLDILRVQSLDAIDEGIRALNEAGDSTGAAALLVLKENIVKGPTGDTDTDDDTPVTVTAEPPVPGSMEDKFAQAIAKKDMGAALAASDR